MLTDKQALRQLRCHFEINRKGLSEYTGIPAKRLESIEIGKSNVRPGELWALIDFMFDHPTRKQQPLAETLEPKLVTGEIATYPQAVKIYQPHFRIEPKDIRKFTELQKRRRVGFNIAGYMDEKRTFVVTHVSAVVPLEDE